jgi:hypothetical protein
MKDINGKKLKSGQTVNVPEPIKGDIHIFEFTGTIADVLKEKGTVIVEDSESDFFEIEGNRLEIV